MLLFRADYTRTMANINLTTRITLLEKTQADILSQLESKANNEPMTKLSSASRGAIYSLAAKQLKADVLSIIRVLKTQFDKATQSK